MVFVEPGLYERTVVPYITSGKLLLLTVNVVGDVTRLLSQGGRWLQSDMG